MVKSENFIYFFTVCGFFIGLMFSILNFSEAENILFYTFEITLFFYLTIHIAVMNFFDFSRIGKLVFNKVEHENISEYFIHELDNREKIMEGLLVSIDNMNQKYDKMTKGSTQSDEPHNQKAA